MKNSKSVTKVLNLQLLTVKAQSTGYVKALEGVNAKERNKFTVRMILQIEKLANGDKLSEGNFPQEGNLPKKSGQQHTKKFRALKRMPLRGYCWLSDKHENTYFISHYIYKAKNKLDTKDTAKVGTNWTRIEEKNDER